MSGIVGSRLNIRGSGVVGSLGTDGQLLTSAGAGQEIAFETATTAAVTALNNATQSELVTVGSTTTELDAEANLTFTGSALTCIGTITVGVDNTGHDVKYFGATSGKYWLWDESADGVVAVSNLQQTGTLTVGVDDTGHDVKLFGATASRYWLWDESADGVVQRGTLTVGVDDTGHDVKFFGATSGSYWQWDESADGVVQIGTLTVGVDDAGHDVKFFGNAASAFMLWDASTDDLVLGGAAKLYLYDAAGGEHISSDGSTLSIAGGGEIDLTATAIDINGTCDISGTFSLAGTNVTSTAAEINYSDLATLGTSAASKVLSADANNLTKITGGVYLEEDTLSFDATQDWDVRASPVAQVTLTANVTFDLPSNPTTGQYISILCIQDGTGSRTIAWNAAFEFTGGTAPTATTTAGKADLFTFRYHNSHWVEVGRNLNLTRA